MLRGCGKSGIANPSLAAQGFCEGFSPSRVGFCTGFGSRSGRLRAEALAWSRRYCNAPGLRQERHRQREFGCQRILRVASARAVWGSAPVSVAAPVGFGLKPSQDPDGTNGEIHHPGKPKCRTRWRASGTARGTPSSTGTTGSGEVRSLGFPCQSPSAGNWVVPMRLSCAPGQPRSCVPGSTSPYCGSGPIWT